MKSWFRPFNIYLTLLGIFLSAGCASSNKSGVDPKKEQSTIRLYLEGNRADTSSTGAVLVTREKFPYTVQREPFLTEADLSKVALVDGGDDTYAIQLLFNDHGSLLMDMTTTANKGHHIIIFSQFPTPGKKQAKEKRKKQAADDDDFMAAPAPLPKTESAPAAAPGEPRQAAWLAAVLIRERNSSGLFRFTPDASREESARIVRGLKNVIAANKKRNSF